MDRVFLWLWHILNSATFWTAFAALVVALYTYYARQQWIAMADTFLEAKRSADAAQKTFELLLGEKERQRRIDIFTVKFQLEAAIHMIEDWRRRVRSESYDLPDVIEIRPTNFSGAITNADRLDHIVAGQMGAGLLYVVEAETDIRVMIDNDPTQYPNSPAAMSAAQGSRKRFQERAEKNLEVAKSKFAEARTRLNEVAK